MKRTKQWWSRLTREERSQVVWLERAANKSSGYGGGGFLPDDCCECSMCSTPHMGYGLCPHCENDLEKLLNKANTTTICITP